MITLFVLLRLENAFSLPIALFVLVIVGVAEATLLGRPLSRPMPMVDPRSARLRKLPMNPPPSPVLALTGTKPAPAPTRP